MSRGSCVPTAKSTFASVGVAWRSGNDYVLVRVETPKDTRLKYIDFCLM